MDIYYLDKGYPEERCIIYKDTNEIYININEKKTWLESLWQKLVYRLAFSLGEKTLPCFWYGKREGVIHTFNTIILGRNRWCCTFESLLPRDNDTRTGIFAKDYLDVKKIKKYTIKLFKRTAKSNCIACLALSQSNFNMQMHALDLLKDFITREQLDSITKKMRVLHPPQETMISIEDIAKKYNNSEDLEFIFIGHDFFRKGGKQIVDILSEYSHSNAIHLTVISRLDYNDYATHTTKDEMLKYKSILKNTKWITYYDTLPNNQILELCKSAHIGLLPTFADTYGYSVLEMQSCGCPVITTDIRALPEINSKECGWICHLPHNEFGEACYSTKEQSAALQLILEQELRTVFCEIFKTSRDKLVEKSVLSLQRIIQQHNPEEYAKTLSKIYHGKIDND